MYINNGEKKFSLATGTIAILPILNWILSPIVLWLTYSSVVRIFFPTLPNIGFFQTVMLVWSIKTVISWFKK